MKANERTNKRKNSKSDKPRKRQANEINKFVCTTPPLLVDWKINCPQTDMVTFRVATKKQQAQELTKKR